VTFDGTSEKDPFWRVLNTGMAKWYWRDVKGEMFIARGRMHPANSRIIRKTVLYLEHMSVMMAVFWGRID
jgi:hypothetical protein